MIYTLMIIGTAMYMGGYAANARITTIFSSDENIENSHLSSALIVAVHFGRTLSSIGGYLMGITVIIKAAQWFIAFYGG